MNIDLLKFLDERVRIRKDISHQEYTVLGILWASEQILLATEGGTISVPYGDLDIIPKNDEEEEGWYSA